MRGSKTRWYWLVVQFSCLAKEAPNFEMTSLLRRIDPLLVALADDPQLPVDAVDGAYLQRRPFSGPQTAGVDDGAAGSVDRVPQPWENSADLGSTEGIG